MDLNNILKIVYDLLVFGSAVLFYYASKKNELVVAAENAIARAEEEYKDATNAGGQKFEFAVDLIYTALPSPIRVMFPREMIANIVQATFDRIEEYAKLQIKKASDKIDEAIDEKFAN